MERYWDMDSYWIECEYCGAPVECKRHKYGGRTRRKYCYDKPCSSRAERLRKEEREHNARITQEVA